jgi:hypothetical protein
MAVGGEGRGMNGSGWGGEGDEWQWVGSVMCQQHVLLDMSGF